LTRHAPVPSFEGEDLIRVQARPCIPSVELIDEGLRFDAQKVGIRPKEAAYVRRRKEIELVRLHAHEEVGAYASFFSRPLDADATLAASRSEVGADRDWFGHVLRPFVEIELKEGPL
jgi:hypothetical protein